VVSRSKPRPATAPVDLDSVLPDLFGISLRSLLARVDELEKALATRPAHAQTQPSDSGVWAGEDFSI
jgi:serine O-acetyltransferase